MTFKTIVHAFGAPCIREVWVPLSVYGTPGDLTTVEVLDLIFQYGQNDFQAKKCPSLSVGDYILLGEDIYMVDNFGFKKLNKVN